MKIELADSSFLEKLKEEHAQELFTLTDANRSHLRQWLPWLDITKSVADTLDFIKRGIAQDANGKGFHCGIWHEERLAGVIGYHKIDREKSLAGVGYWLGREAQGKGLATLSCGALIEYAIRELRLERVEIHCATGNQRSQAIPERLGLKRDREIPKAEYLYGRYVDHVVYSVLARDWPAEKKPKPH